MKKPLTLGVTEPENCFCGFCDVSLIRRESCAGSVSESCGIEWLCFLAFIPGFRIVRYTLLVNLLISVTVTETWLYFVFLFDWEDRLRNYFMMCRVIRVGC